MDEDLKKQLQALGISPSDDVFRTGSEQYDQNGLCSPIPQEVHFMNAELRRCRVEGVGVLLCLFSGSGHVYEFVRTLRKCIYGKVKHAVRLHLTAQGTFVRTNLEVAIKIMSKVRIVVSLSLDVPPALRWTRPTDPCFRQFAGDH
jgi:hypothetical protein